MTDLFEVVAPEPMHKFEGEWRENQQNIEAEQMHRAHGDVRKILNKSQLKRYKRFLASIEKELTRNGVYELLEEERPLDEEWSQLLAQRYRLKKTIETSQDKLELRKAKSSLAIVYENARSIKADRHAIKRRIAPYRRWIIRADRLRARIDEHEAGLKDEEINKGKRARLDKEANTVAEIIVRTLNGMGFCFRTSKNGRERVISIGFSRLVVTPDTIQLKLKMGYRGLFGGYKHLVPRDVQIASALKNEAVMAQIAASIEMPVSCPQAESGRWSEGFWLFVQRNGLRDGLPDSVSYTEYMKRYPVEKRHLLPFPAGLKEGMWASWMYLANTPHIIVTGQTGSGKTVAMLSMISTFISNHSPAEIQFIMVDLKEGAELYRFNGIPHLIGEVLTDIETVSEVVWRLEAIRRERMNEFRKAGVNDITHYNATHTDLAMPHIAIIFDEFGALQSSAYRGQAGTIFNVCSQLAMKARAAGIHLVIGAQTPRKEHVPPDVKDNITFKLTGRQGTLGGSLAATGTSAANKIEKRPGRFWCEDGLDAYPVQMPGITHNQVDEAIARAKLYDAVELVDIMPKDGDETLVIPAATVKKSFTLEDFIDIVIEKLQGVINYTEVFNMVKDDYQVSFRDLQKMAEGLRQVEMIEHGEKTYKVVARGRGRVLVEDDVISISTNGYMPIGAD